MKHLTFLLALLFSGSVFAEPNVTIQGNKKVVDASVIVGIDPNGKPVPVAVSTSGGLSVSAAAGGATEAKQDTGNTSLSNINAKLPATLGQTAKTGSMSVTIASDQVLTASLATVTATGTITTQNLVPAGVATANSAVEITLSGAAAMAFQVTGTYTGALSVQTTVDGTTWVTTGGTPILNENTGGLLATVTSALQSVFKVECAGALKARVTGLSAMTGTATVTMIALGNTPVLSLDSALPTGTNTIGALTANQSVNVAQIAGTTTVTGGVSGIQAIGGNIAVGTARTANPLPTGGVDASALTRVGLFDTQGKTITHGSGELMTFFSVGTGAAAVTDGTNGKTMYLQPREADVEVNFTAISTTPTFQLEGSFDNVLFFIIPMSRLDNTAASQSYTAVAAFTPAVGNVYRGKTYGAPILRAHLVAGSASNTVGVVRVVYNDSAPNQLLAPVGFTATGTTESVGVANGQVLTGSARTLSIPTKGAAQATLYADAITGTLTYAAEISTDGGTTYNAAPMQPSAGGATVTSVAATGSTAAPQTGTFYIDCSNATHIRARCTAYTSGTFYGGLKVVPSPVNTGVGLNRTPTYTVSSNGLTPTAATNLMVIESGATKTVRLKKLTIQPGFATTSGFATLTVSRNTVAASAAGTQVSGATMQRVTTDAAFGGIARVGAFTVAGVTTTDSSYIITLATPASTLAPATPIVIDFTTGGNMEPFAIPVGTTNGLMLKHSGLAGATGFGITAEFTEE